MTTWPKSPLIYEINTRVWLAEVSAQCGAPVTLANVPLESIDRLCELGFNAVWLMGVWTTGAEPVEIARAHSALQSEFRNALSDYAASDCIGSPYAVSSYRVAAELGGPDGLAKFRERLARRGLKLMLDFVCNHTARDHWLVREHPEVFVNGTADDLARQPDCFFQSPNGTIIAHGRDPYFAPWTDTAQINYMQPAGRERMLEKLKLIAAQCDGVRCDMAMLILPDIMLRTWSERLGPSPNLDSFWKEAVATVRETHPDFLFLGEAYWDLEWQLQQEGFDYTYDKKLYDRLLKSDFDGVRSHLRADLDFLNRSAHFVENHDEARAAEAFGSARSQSAAVASFFTPGLRLLHDGQFEARRVKVPVQLRRRPQENVDVEMEVFYERVLRALSDPTFQNGNFSQMPVHSAGWGDQTSGSLVAVMWSPAKTSSYFVGYLVVSNLSGGRAYGRIPLPREQLLPQKHYIFYDRLEDKRYDRHGEELLQPGMYVALEPYRAHVFEISNKGATTAVRW